MGKRKDLRYWNVPVTESLDRAVEEILERGMYSTKVDLIREAVREKLEKMGVKYATNHKSRSK